MVFLQDYLKMTEETLTPTPKSEEPNPKQQLLALEQQVEENSEVINNLTFFSSPVRFNAVIFKGFRVILDKITKMEENLQKIELKLNERKDTI